MLRRKHLVPIFVVLLGVSMLVSTAAATGNASPALSADCFFDADEKIVLSKGETWGPVEFTAYELGTDLSLVIYAKAWTRGSWSYTGKLTIIVEDLYIMGDTIFVDSKAGFRAWPRSAYAEAASPSVVTVSHMVLFSSVITADIGYTACPGGFGAGYQVTITFD